MTAYNHTQLVHWCSMSSCHYTNVLSVVLTCLYSQYISNRYVQNLLTYYTAICQCSNDRMVKFSHYTRFIPGVVRLYLQHDQVYITWFCFLCYCWLWKYHISFWIFKTVFFVWNTVIVILEGFQSSSLEKQKSVKSKKKKILLFVK